ncbi:hypothetical protein GCM10027203_29290 [Nonomuraea fastidiosa]
MGLGGDLIGHQREKVLFALDVRVQRHRAGAELGRHAAVQWTVTAYLLALSMTVPVTGWATGRFGARRVWLAALVLLLAEPGDRPQPLDLAGLALLSPGLAAVVYGLSEPGGGALPVLPAGLALVAAFVVRALRSPGTLLDLRLFGDSKGGRGIGAAGVVVATAGIVAFALLGGGFAPMFLVGLGHGLVSTSVMAAAFATLERSAIPAATTLSTIAVRLAAPFGVAVLTMALQAFTAAGVARPFAYAFWVVAGLTAVSLVPIALIGSKTWRRSSSAPA